MNQYCIIQIRNGLKISSYQVYKVMPNISGKIELKYLVLKIERRCSFIDEISSVKPLLLSIFNIIMFHLQPTPLSLSKISCISEEKTVICTCITWYRIYIWSIAIACQVPDSLRASSKMKKFHFILWLLGGRNRCPYLFITFICTYILFHVMIITFFLWDIKI